MSASPSSQSVADRHRKEVVVYKHLADTVQVAAAHWLRDMIVHSYLDIVGENTPEGPGIVVVAEDAYVAVVDMEGTSAVGAGVVVADTSGYIPEDCIDVEVDVAGVELMIDVRDTQADKVAGVVDIDCMAAVDMSDWRPVAGSLKVEIVVGVKYHLAYLALHPGFLVDGVPGVASNRAR